MNIKLTKEIKEEIIKSFSKLGIQKVIKGIGNENGSFEMIISTEQKDRAGEVVKQSGIDTSFYKDNPVVLWAHNYASMPIGITDKIVKKNKQTIAKGRFAPSEEGQQLRKLYDAGFIKTASIGFIPLETEDGVISKSELLEWSFVPVPANAGALSILSKDFDVAGLVTKGIIVKEEESEENAIEEEENTSTEDVKNTEEDEITEETEVKEDEDDNINEDEKDEEDESNEEIEDIKTVVPYKDMGQAPVDDKWNAGEVEKEVWGDGDNQKKYASIHAWFDGSADDKDGDGYPDEKGAYKLPHHDTSFKAVWGGVAAAMGALLGARGGVKLPEKDRKGVYNHLAKHYKEFKKDVPEFKEYTEEEIKSMFGEDIKINNLELAGSILSKMQSQIDTVLNNASKDILTIIDKNKSVVVGQEPVYSESESHRETDETKQRSESKDFSDSKDFNNFITTRNLLRGVDTVINKTLARLNKTAKENKIKNY